MVIEKNYSSSDDIILILALVELGVRVLWFNLPHYLYRTYDILGNRLIYCNERSSIYHDWIFGKKDLCS